MANTYKVLGQVAPDAATPTVAYTVPASTQSVLSTIFVCNRAAINGSYRIAIVPSGESIGNKHYIVSDTVLSANSTDAFTNGITLAASDTIVVYADSANFSFSLFGSEIS